MAWRRSGDKPLSEPMMVSLPTHICVTRPQWVNTLRPRQDGRNFYRWHFHMHFLEWKVLYFDLNFTEVCSQGFNWQNVCIGSGNGLVPNRRQAIIWPTSLRHICSSRGELSWSIYLRHWGSHGTENLIGAFVDSLRQSDDYASVNKVIIIPPPPPPPPPLQRSW